MGDWRGLVSIVDIGALTIPSSSTVPVDIENFSAALCDYHFETQDQNARVKPHDEWKECRT